MLCGYLYKKYCIIKEHGDARLRRERLTPDCEPRGAELEKPAQNYKCQPHFLCCSSARCISEQESSGPSEEGPVRLSRSPAGDRIGRKKAGVPHVSRR